MPSGTASFSDLWKYKILTGIRPGGNMQRMTFTRADAATSATYAKYVGPIWTEAANILRVEWVDLDGDGVRETPGILLEGSRTNAFTKSQKFDDAVWTKFGATISADATTAPDGTLTADKIVESALNENHGVLRTT